MATEVAVGASIAGVRSMACNMKHVGLNVAADPLYSVSYMGVNGGLVLVVADDRDFTALRTSRIQEWLQNSSDPGHRTDPTVPRQRIALGSF